MEEDINGGRSPPLPELSEDEWNLLLSAPAFQMSTSMHYTVKVRRRQTSSNAASSFSGASGGSQGGAAGGTPGNRESAGLGGSSDESSDESEDGSAASDGASDTEVVAEGPQVRPHVLVSCNLLLGTCVLRRSHVSLSAEQSTS